MKTTMLAMLMAVGLVGCDGGATSNPMPGVSMTQSIDQEGLMQLQIGFRNPAAKHTVIEVIAGDVVAERVVFDPGEQMHTVTLSIDGAAHLSLRYQADGLLRPESVPTPDPAGPEGHF